MKRLKQFLCETFGHRWLYGFGRSTSRIDIRTCKTCNRIDYWTELWTLGGTKELWMMMVTYTDKGAKEKLGKKYQP